MQFSLRNLILAIAAIAITIALVGRITPNGTIITNHKDAVNIERVLGDYGISDFSRHGARIYFPMPFRLNSIDQTLIQDATNRGYFIKIEYKTLIPQFSSTRVVNAELDLHERP